MPPTWAASVSVCHRQRPVRGYDLLALDPPILAGRRRRTLTIATAPVRTSSRIPKPRSIVSSESIRSSGPVASSSSVFGLASTTRASIDLGDLQDLGPVLRLRRDLDQRQLVRDAVEIGQVGDLETSISL